MNINEWPKEAKEVFIKLLNEHGFHNLASMINLGEHLQFEQLVEMAKDERTVKDELIKEVMSAVTEEHLKLFDEYSKMKAEEEAARHETIMINREIAKHQLDKVNEEAVKQTEQSEPEQKVEPQRIELGSSHTKIHGELKYQERGGTLDKIHKIYNYLISTESIDTDVEWQYFILSIRRADLGEIYSSPKTKKSNFLYAVGFINQNMEHGWLEDVLSSMNIKKSKFGGKHPTTYFVNGFPRK